MLYTKDLEDVILYAPALVAGSACSSLKIISGFTDCERISSHLISLLDGIKEKKYVSSIKTSLILGMTKGSSLTKKKHKKICQTIKRIRTMRGMPKITCRYIASGQEVHSKVYLWSKGNTPEVAFCGSANYSINAFQRRRECMTDCDPNEAKAYYNSLYKDSIDCFDPDIEIKMSFAETAVPFIEDVSDDNIEKLSYEEYAQKTPIDQIRVSLLMAKGDVGYGSGINWGIRPNGTPRNRNQAYIPYNKKDRKAGFFPERVNPNDKHCPLFKVITKEAGAFYMRLAQDRDKGIHSADSNAIIGKWIREKIGASDGQFVTKEMLERYGATSVVFKKYENDIYVLEFEPFKTSQENEA